MSELSPIVLFVYNRPEHTEKTLAALAMNELADQSTLYIYADGAKNSSHSEGVNETRIVLRKRKWCKKVVIIESDVNKGLADSIVSGVTEVVNKHGKVIVLEDDLNTSKGFLKYMNEALTMYEDDEKVMHISGYMYPISPKYENGTIFLRILSCWGWATWKRAWANYSNEIEGHLNKLKSQKSRDKFNIKGSATFYDQLVGNINGTMKTWAVRWYASWYFKGGYTLFPKTTLVNNIGHDGTGVHCGTTDFYATDVIAQKIDIYKQPLKEDEFYLQLIDDFYNRISPRKIRKKMTFRIMVNKLKSRIYKTFKKVLNQENH